MQRPWVRELLRIAGINVVIALGASLLFIWFRPGASFRFYLWSVAFGLIYSNCIGGLAAVTMPYVVALAPARPAAARWAAVVGALLVLGTVGCLAAVSLIFLLHFPGATGSFWAYYYRSFKIAILITMGVGLGIHSYEVFRNRMAATALELRTKELERERALKLATEARLSSLESRLHPHFLFNTLNSISSLIPEDPARAEKLVERMAALLRFSLDSGRSGLVPLEQELKIVVDYLEIEKARFAGRLSYSLEVPAGVGKQLVPPLSVQTLAENSIKHAVAPAREGGEVRIRVRSEGERLHLEVWDSGPGFAWDAIAAGHGLDTLQARLATLFEEQGRLRVDRADGGTVVSLEIPSRAEERA